MKLLTKVIIGFSVVVLVGCNYRYLRTKPTTFVAMNGKSQAPFSCMDATEHLLDMNFTQSIVCDGYITVDYHQVEKSSEDKKEIASKLFYVSDRNCKRFTDRFYYNNVAEDSANKFLGLRVWNIGIGIDLSKIGEIPTKKFNEFEKNLRENMQGRKALKKKINSNILNDSNYSRIEMLSDFIEYDRSCSLVPSYEGNQTK
jgi:hypothetical protein